MTTSFQDTILGFNPVSETVEVFQLDITPQMDQYILIHHNKDNRKVTNSQVNKIAKSIRTDGWTEDGRTYLQHRRKYHRGTTPTARNRCRRCYCSDVVVLVCNLIYSQRAFKTVALKMIQRKDKSTKMLKSARFVNSLSVVKVLNSP